MAYLGKHELHINASLDIYPSITTSSSIILPIEFIRCPVELSLWQISDTTVPPVTNIKQEVEGPFFVYPTLDCDYYWMQFTIEAVNQYGIDVTSRISNYISLVVEEGFAYFTYLPQALVDEDLVLSVTVTASMSDLLTIS